MLVLLFKTSASLFGVTWEKFKIDAATGCYSPVFSGTTTPSLSNQGRFLIDFGLICQLRQPQSTTSIMFKLKCKRLRIKKTHTILHGCFMFSHLFLGTPKREILIPGRLRPQPPRRNVAGFDSWAQLRLTIWSHRNREYVVYPMNFSTEIDFTLW